MDPKKLGKVAVLMGGTSSERDVSLSSGQGVLEALIEAGVDAYKVDVQRDFHETFNAKAYDRAFIILHGRDGEDGKIQALLDYWQLPYTGSGMMASALCMDKYRCKLVVQGLGLRTPRFLLADLEFDITLLRDFKLPFAVKPLHEGSSFGVTRVDHLDDLPAALKLAREFHDEVMIEEWIAGGEYTIPVIRGAALPSIKVSTPKRPFYDFDAKYVTKDTVYECPNDLDANTEANLKVLTEKIFHALGCRSWGRADFMRDANGDFYFIEMNTVPGMTPTSLPLKSARTLGMTYQDLVLAILADTVYTQTSRI